MTYRTCHFTVILLEAAGASRQFCVWPDLGMGLSFATRVYYVGKLSCHDILIKSKAGMPKFLSCNAMFANGPAV